MGSTPSYSEMPSDWHDVGDIRVELRRVTGRGYISGCMRLWVWLMMCGVRGDDGSMSVEWMRGSIDLNVTIKQVYVWKRELEYVGWIKRKCTGSVWVHPSMDMVRRCDVISSEASLSDSPFSWKMKNASIRVVKEIDMRTALSALNRSISDAELYLNSNDDGGTYATMIKEMLEHNRITRDNLIHNLNKT